MQDAISFQEPPTTPSQRK